MAINPDVFTMALLQNVQRFTPELISGVSHTTGCPLSARASLFFFISDRNDERDNKDQHCKLGSRVLSQREGRQCIVAFRKRPPLHFSRLSLFLYVTVLVCTESINQRTGLAGISSRTMLCVRDPVESKEREFYRKVENEKKKEIQIRVESRKNMWVGEMNEWDRKGETGNVEKSEWKKSCENGRDGREEEMRGGKRRTKRIASGIF